MVHAYVTYDSQADVLYVQFEGPEEHERASRDHGGDRFVEYGPDGAACGVEFLGASAGVDPAGLPREGDIREALRHLVGILTVPAQV